MASLRHGDHDCGAHNCEGQSLYKFIDHPGARQKALTPARYL
jgi:hypothetical protein